MYNLVLMRVLLYEPVMPTVSIINTKPYCNVADVESMQKPFSDPAAAIKKCFLRFLTLKSHQMEISNSMINVYNMYCGFNIANYHATGVENPCVQ